MTRHVCANVEDMCARCESLALDIYEGVYEPEPSADAIDNRAEAEMDRRWGG